MKENSPEFREGWLSCRNSEKKNNPYLGPKDNEHPDEYKQWSEWEAGWEACFFSCISPSSSVV